MHCFDALRRESVGEGEEGGELKRELLENSRMIGRWSDFTM